MRQILLKLFLAGISVLSGLAPVQANQSNAWSPTTGTVTGLQLTTNYNNAFSAILSCNSGNTSPTNDQSAAAIKGQCWLDTSTTPNPVRQYSGAAWLIVGWLDQTNGFWIANEAGGTGTVVSAGTTDLCASTNAIQSVTGTTTVTSFGSNCIAGARKWLNFTGALTLTHNATSLILPNNSSNIVTAAGDSALAIYQGGGNWRVNQYTKANGASLTASANFTSTVSMNNVIAGGALAASQNNFAPSGIATANVVRLTCTAAGVNIRGLVAPSPSIDGQTIVFDVLPASTNACTFTSNDALASAGNQFLFEKPITVRPGRTLTVKYDLTSLGWVSLTETPEQMIAQSFRNLRLLNVTNALGDTAPGTPQKQYKAAFEAITLEDAFGGAKRISAPITVIDATGTNSYTATQTPTCTPDVTGSGAGGLDTGSQAAFTWYFFWFGYNPTTNVLTCYFSIGSTQATTTPPAGYTFRGRFGAIQTDTNPNFYRMQQYGRIAHYVNVAATNTLGPQAFASGNQAGCSTTSPALVTKTVAGNTFPAPITATRVNVFVSTAGGGGTCIMVAPSAAWNGTNNGPTGTNGLVWPSSTGIGTNIVSSWWLTLESTSLFYAASNHAANIAAIGDYEDSF